jgi:hypothetical protein
MSREINAEIKINNSFSVEGRPHQWKLHRYTESINKKTQEVKQHKSTTFYGKLEHALNAALNESLKERESICDILTGIEEFKIETLKAVQAIKTF